MVSPQTSHDPTRNHTTENGPSSIKRLRRRSRGSWHQRVKDIFGRSRESSNDILAGSAGMPELVLSESVPNETLNSFGSHGSCMDNDGQRVHHHGNSLSEHEVEERQASVVPVVHAQASRCLNCTKYFRSCLSQFSEFCSLDCKSAHSLRSRGGGLPKECSVEHGESNAPQPYYYIC